MGRACDTNEQWMNYKKNTPSHTIREDRDWKTKDEMGGWCGSRQWKNRRKELEETGWQEGWMEKASEEGRGPLGAVDPVIIMMIVICTCHCRIWDSPTERDAGHVGHRSPHFVTQWECQECRCVSGVWGCTLCPQSCALPRMSGAGLRWELNFC